MKSVLILLFLLSLFGCKGPHTSQAECEKYCKPNGYYYTPPNFLSDEKFLGECKCTTNKRGDE